MKKITTKIFFSAASGGTVSRLPQEMAEKYAISFGLSTDVVKLVLASADQNSDGFWNPDEYAQALHKLRFILEKQIREEGVPPMTDNESKAAYMVFDVFRRKGKFRMKMHEILDKVKIKGVSPEIITEIFTSTDVDKNGSWNADEFAEGWHRLLAMSRKIQGKEGGTIQHIFLFFFFNVQNQY